MNPFGNDNPNDICTAGHESNCTGCTISGKLKCRLNVVDWLKFLLLFSVFLVPGLIGMGRGGYSNQIGWMFVFWIFFFGFWEIKILCSHCPYYAKKGLLLECPANLGCPKLWKYNPAPINRWEKFQLVIGFGILFGYPIYFSIIGEQYLWAGLAALGTIVFFVILGRNTCSKCVNFSCIFNRVPKEVVDEYLKKNEVMRKAWEEAGYKIGND